MIEALGEIKSFTRTPRVNHVLPRGDVHKTVAAGVSRKIYFDGEYPSHVAFMDAIVFAVSNTKGLSIPLRHPITNDYQSCHKCNVYSL